MKKIYVGNLSYDATEDDLVQLFSAHGTVLQATIIRDKWDNRSKGFGFVEMEDEDEANTAISALDGTEVGGRRIKVNEARERQSGGGGGGHRGGGGGGHRGGGGGGHRGGGGGGHRGGGGGGHRGGGGGGGGGRRW